MAKTDLSKMDQEFVSKAAQDNVAEIEMAKLAQKKAKSSKFRQFADIMLDDHAKAKDKLTKMASSMGWSVPKELSGEHRKLLDEMSKYDGDEFERQFISVVSQEHQKDINLYHSESEHGGNEDLKRFAAELTPILQKHFEMAKSLQH
jgi:putative membrane protein